MRITRSTLRRLIAEESARLLREAAEEEITTTNEAERGKKRKKRDDADCLYVLFGGRGAYFYTAPCGLSEEEAVATGNNVTDDVVGGEDDRADPLDLYDWLGRHDEITAVYDFESAGGEVSKDDYMAQLEDVARSDGLLADDEFVNEEDADTAENDDLNEADDEPLDEMDDYEHAYAMGGGSDEEGFAIDYDTGRPSPFAAKMFGQPAAGADDIEGADADEDVFGDDAMGRSGAMDDYRHAYKLGGGRDEEGFAADYDTGKKRQFPPARGGLSEARWAKLAGILKG